LRGLFVTGTDTGVGKTVVAAAIAASLRARGVAVKAVKPVVTGLEDPGPHDHEVLARAAGCGPADVSFECYGPAVSPHLAAEIAGREIDPTALEAAIQDARTDDEMVVVEGVGGLLVPLAESYDVRDLACSLGLPLVIAARPGLGTINHTLLTVEAARAASLEVAAVVITPWPEPPGTVELSNRDTIRQLGEVEVATLPYVERAHVTALARAGQCLPVDDWLCVSDRSES
jgi:dethiobiotin synthetase